MDAMDAASVVDDKSVQMYDLKKKIIYYKISCKYKI